MFISIYRLTYQIFYIILLQAKTHIHLEMFVFLKLCVPMCHDCSKKGDIGIVNHFQPQTTARADTVMQVSLWI